MTEWPSDRVTKWPSDRVTKWPSDRVTGSFADDWPYGIFTEYRNNNRQCKEEWQTMMAMRTHYADIDHGRKEMNESNNYRILLLSTVYTSIEYSSSCIATCVTLHHRSSAQLSGRTMMAGTKIWNISNFMIKHSSITSCTTFVLVVKYFQAQRFYPNISDFWNSTPAAPDTSLLQRWSMMRVAGGAVKRSIGFTISFHNHGEGPY